MIRSTLILMIGLCVPHLALADGGNPLEYEVKAAYLYKFGGFVAWPASVFTSPQSPLNVCVVGEDPFDGILDRAIDGHSIGDHPVVVHRMKNVTRETECQILYVGGSNVRHVSQTLDAVRGNGVLTVTDAANGEDAGAIVQFVIQDNRVRFVVNNNAAVTNGLVISSKLLSIALAVKSKP